MDTAATSTGFICPVCGYAGLARRPYAKMKGIPAPAAEGFDPPYSTFLGEPSFEVCPCCGFEFGGDDEPATGAAGVSFAEYRAKWLEDGAHWFEPARKPEGWESQRQLRAARLAR